MKEKEERRWKRTGQREEGGERRKKVEEDGRHRWPDVERREGAGSGHVRKEGASEGITSTSGSAGSRSRTYPTFYPDIMDVTARAGSGTSALCGIPAPSTSSQQILNRTGPGNWGMECSLQNVT